MLRATLRMAGATVASALLAACGIAEQVRDEPWRMWQTPTNRYMVLFDERYGAGMRRFYRKDYDGAIICFGQAYDAAERLKLEGEKGGSPLTLARSMMWNALRGLGMAHEGRREPAEAESYRKQALELSPSIRGPDSQFVGHSLSDLAVGYLQQGRYEEALPPLQRAARIFEAAGNRFDLAVVLDNIGHVHAGQGQTAEAEASFGRALATTEAAMGRKTGPGDRGWFQRILHMKDYVAALRKSGSGEADRLDARLRELISEERKHTAALRERGRADDADVRETRLRDILSPSPIHRRSGDKAV